MSDGRWARAKELFAEALDRSESTRGSWLEQACAGDAELLAEVRRRLEWDAAAGDSFLRTAPATRLRRDEGVPALLQEGELLAGRYRLGPEIGQGSSGRVHRARDELLDCDVAAKLLPVSAADSGFLHEVAALHLLDVPGVLQLLDEGEDAGCRFLVTPLVEGRPFGEGGPHRWEDLSTSAVALLETLGRMHAVGLVHRDLKPANVLVTPEGVPQVLDLGLAQELDARDDPAMIVGTPAYLSPEQLGGGKATTRSDLYAVGLMLHEALAGRPVHAGDSHEQVFRARLDHPAPPLGSRVQGCPEEVARLVDSLLARDPRDRPADAAEALHRLGIDARFLDAPPELAELARSRPTEAIAPERLQAFFHGPDRVLHLAEDGAAQAIARSDGTCRGVLLEMGAWVRSGRAAWEDGRLNVSRAELDRLSADEPGADPLAAARALLLRGRAGAAAGLLTGLLAAPRLDPGRSLRPGVLEELVEAALVSGERRVLVHALAAAEALAASRPDQAEALQAGLVLLRAGRLVFEGGAGRARRRLQELGPLDSPRVEYCRRNLLLLAARPLGRDAHAQAVAEVVDWSERAGDEAARRLACVARGWLAYERGDFAEAAGWHEQAASRARGPAEELGPMIAATMALLEDFQLEAGQDLASRAIELAQAHRVTLAELQARQLLREAAYRAGRDVEPDEQLALAAQRCAPPLRLASVLLSEASFAWRAGRRSDAARLATSSSESWRLAQRRGIALLPGALAADCGDTARADELGDELVELHEGLPPGVVAQTAALLWPHVREPAALQELVLRCSEEIPTAHRHRRREVLSIDECLARIDGGS